MAKKDKRVKCIESVNSSKTPKLVENPQSYLRKSPVWSFKIVDNGYTKWGLKHVEDINETIVEKLKSYEGMTWDEILKATGGKKTGNGNNSHYESISSLITEAQKRWSDLKLDEYDQVFSLRLTGAQRLYGLLQDGIFEIIWFDPIHEIYNSKRR